MKRCLSWCNPEAWNSFTKCVDYQIIIGKEDFVLQADKYTTNDGFIGYEHAYHIVWPMYAWTAFCLQWHSIGWAMLVGKP